MRLYSTAFLMASAAVTMAACIQTPAGPNSSSNNSSLSGGDTEVPIVKDLPPPTKEGEEFFNTQVLPTMKSGGQVACTGCHTSGFEQAPKFLVGATEHDVYLNVRYYRDGALIQPPSVNLFLNKGPHEGPDLNPNQFSIIKKWAEIENKSDNNAPPQNFFEKLREFEGCLDFDQFQTQQLDKLANQPVTGNETCGGCHISAVKGPGLFLDPNNAQKTFQAFQQFPNVLKLVSATVSATGSFVSLQPSNRLVDKGREFPGCSADDVKAINFNVDDPNYCHPEYEFNEKFRRQIETFVNSTLSDAKTINCKNRL